MFLDLYKNLSDNGKLIVIESGKPLKDQILGIDWSQYVILSNGRKVSPDFIPTENDYIVIRRIPGAEAATVIAWVAIAVAVISGIAAGVTMYKTRQQQKKLREMQEAMSARDDVSNIPWLQGASNAIATGKSQPYIVGRHLFTPYLLQQSFYKISGTDGINQDVYITLEGGFGPQAIRQIKAEDVMLYDFGNQTTPQRGSSYRPQSGLFKYISEVNDNLIQIEQNRALGSTGSTISSAFYIKHAVEEPNVMIPWREDCEQWQATKQEEYTERVWVDRGDDGYYRDVKRTRTVTYTDGEIKTETKKFTLDPCAKNVEICIMFNGLCKYSNSGKKQSHTRSIGFRYSTNGGTSWSALDVGGGSTSDGYYVVSWTKSSTSQLRYVKSHTFTWAQGKAAYNNGVPIIVEVTNRDKKSTAKGGAYEDCYVQWVQSELFDAEKSSDSNPFVPCKVLEDKEASSSTIIALKLRASTENETKLGKINVITSGAARTWNGSSWSSSKSATSNPASWLLEVLTSDIHPASRFADSEIDLASFGALYSFCQTNGFSVNYVITQGQKKSQILETICNTCRCMLYRDIYGKIAVAIDKEKDNAVALLNAQNILGVEITKSFARRTDGLKLSWVDASSGYAQAETICMRPNTTRTADSIIREMDVQGITGYAHLMKYARYIMASEVLRPKTVKVRTGAEGVYYTPYSKILMQDDSLRVGLGNATIGAVITSGGNIVGLRLNEYIDLDGSHDFGVIINCISDNYCTQLAKQITVPQGNTRVNEILFETPFSVDSSVIPHAGDVLSYGYLGENGEFDSISSPYIITGIEPGDNEVTLQLLDYNPDVYTTGDYGEYVPNITRKTEPYTPVVIPPPETSSDVEDILSGDNMEAPDIPTGITVVATKDGLRVSCSKPDTSSIKNTIAKVVWELALDGFGPEDRPDEPHWIEYSTTGYEYLIPYPSSVQYPEASDMYDWLVRCKFVSVYDKESDYGDYTTVDTDSYGTWQVQSPVIVLRTNKRSLHAHLEQPPTSNVYGNVRYRVQISRYDDTEEGERLWYQPNLSADPYGAEDNYKGALDGYVVVVNDFSITVPLEGQSATPAAPSDTLYYLRFTPFNEAGTGTPVVSDQMNARATGARDVVLAHMGDGTMNTDALTAQNIYTENLAAITGMFAQIRDGAETADNFWDMENSEFRVGNDHTLEGETLDQDDPAAQYIHFKNGDLKMHISKLIADISQSYVKGIFDIYSSDQLYRCRVSEQGLTLQSRASLAAAWETKGVFTLNPANGSLMITNTAPSTDYTIAKPSGAKVYHFQESAGTDPLDDNGTNGEGLTFGNYTYEDSSPILISQVQYYQGQLSKTGLTTKSSATYGTAAYCAADNNKYDAAYGYYASRVASNASAKTATLYIRNTLTGTTTSKTVTISDSNFTSFGQKHSFWYNGQCYFGVIYNRSGSPASKFILYNSAGTAIWQPTELFNHFTFWNNTVYAQYAAVGTNLLRVGSYAMASGNKRVQSGSISYSAPTALKWTWGEPYFYYVGNYPDSGTCLFPMWVQGGYVGFINILWVSSVPTHTFGTEKDGFCRYYQEPPSGYGTAAYHYWSNKASGMYDTKINLVDYKMIEGGAVYDGSTLQYIWCLRVSDGQLGQWNYSSGSFTAVGGTAARYTASHSWIKTNDMLLDANNGAAYRLVAYNQSSSATKNYAFWYNGSSVKLGSFTLATPSEWCYITIALASGTITWHIYKTDGTSTTGTYNLSTTYTDSVTADNTDFILNGSVEEFSYGVLPSGTTLEYIVSLRVPYGDATNLPIADQFIVNAKDPSKVTSNAFWCKNEEVLISKPAIGVPTMWFGAKPSWAIDFGNGATDKYLWANYPKLYTAEFRSILRQLSDKGWCTAQDDTGFYVPDLRGIVPIGYGTNEIRTGETYNGGSSAGAFIASQNKYHNHGVTKGGTSSSGFTGTKATGSIADTFRPENSTASGVFSVREATRSGRHTDTSSGNNKYFDFAMTPAGTVAVSVNYHGSAKQASKPATIACMWIVRYE